jgi:putative glycerol-1-phosphate prenyltransferase
MLGLKMIYMDAGSGAANPVPTQMIEAVSNAINIPLIVGGGIKDPETIAQNLKAGADIIVVGNAIEHNPNLLGEMKEAFDEYSHL